MCLRLVALFSLIRARKTAVQLKEILVHLEWHIKLRQSLQSRFRLYGTSMNEALWTFLHASAQGLAERRNCHAFRYVEEEKI